jgi:hypothetical protein
LVWGISRGIAVPNPYAFLPRLIISTPVNPQAAQARFTTHQLSCYYITPLTSQPPFPRVLSSPIQNLSIDPKRCQFANRLLIHHELDSILLILESSPKAHIYRLRNPNRLPSSRNSRDQFLTCTDQRQRFPLPLVPTTYHGDGLVTILSASE